MKKTVWTLILGTVATLACACGFSGCSKGGTKGLVFEEHPERTDELIVVGFEGNSQIITIPREHEGKPVKGIADGVFENSGIVSVTLPEGLSYIGDNAFAGCKRLETVRHKNCFYTIGDNAFYGCDKLSSIELEGHTTYPKTIGERAFYGCESITVVPFDGIGIDKDIYIGDEAFANCSGLTSVSLPTSIAYLGKDVFANCDSLQYNIKSGLKYLGNTNNPYACLMGATDGISVIELDEGCNVIAPFALANCTSVSEMVLPNMKTHLGAYFGAPTADENASYVPTSVRKVTVSGAIPNRAFYGCANVTEIDVSSVHSISYGAFENCTGLTSMILPRYMSTIGSSIWKGCTNLAEVSVPFLEQGSSASDGAFRYYFGNIVPESLKKVTVESGIIPKNAFSYCRTITHITLKDDVHKIEDYAFMACNALQELTIPRKVERVLANYFEGCYSLTNIIVDPANTKFQTIDGSLYTKDGLWLAKYAVGKTDISFTVPSNVTSVWAGAFAGNTTLQTVVLPSAITKINSDTFAGCTALQSISIPDGVTKIDENAFRYCRNLKTVTLGDNVQEVGKYAFDECDSLNCNVYENVKYLPSASNAYCIALGVASENTLVTQLHENAKIIAGSAFQGCLVVKEMTIPNGVERISESAFANCLSLENLYLGSGVTAIDTYAFQNCSNLKQVVVPSSVTNMGESVFSGCTGLTSATIDASITAIPDKTFSGCTSLTDVDLGDIAGLGEDAFAGCIGLQDFGMFSNITGMECGAFQGCTGFTQIVFSENLTNVSGWAFRGCTGLTKVVISASVTAIGNYAFQNCSNLVEAYILGGDVSYVGDYVFEKCGDLTIYCATLESLTDSWYYSWCRKQQGSYEEYDVEWNFAGSTD
ncbi:MAG: leucine-rich repeat domain-containing protein [Clostridia bacterium]|nr:leucine-rich repeat domain-containing protein [Clostridia bacterium]